MKTFGIAACLLLCLSVAANAQTITSGTPGLVMSPIHWPSGNLSFDQPSSNSEFMRLNDSGGTLNSYFNFDYLSSTNSLRLSGGGSSANMTVSAAGTGNVILGSSTAGMLVTSGGEIQIFKITDPNTAPGAGKIKLTVEAGTNAGTCKLVARAGTSATPVTIIDNVGSGC